MRRLALLPAAAALATGWALGPVTPASADIDACAGTGYAILSVAFGYPVNTVHVLHPHTSNFSFSIITGTCATKPTLTANGSVTGYCGLSSGSGSTFNAHSFSFTGTGTVLVLTGDLTGIVATVPDPVHSGSCTDETATRFLFTGAVLKTHGTLPQAPRSCDATTTAC
ncbi:MAG TPA: hypothetical protein VM938_04685 [Acidimicrobiales bacterium]|nr:hypothetical protein [Acidimicrobiales bacterium]